LRVLDEADFPFVDCKAESSPHPANVGATWPDANLGCALREGPG